MIATCATPSTCPISATTPRPHLLYFLCLLWLKIRMREPEVSVVVATYNRCEILPGTLDSLINQEGTTSYEVIVVDNNSTDDTRNVIAKLREKPGYKKLTYHFEEKQGVSHA